MSAAEDAQRLAMARRWPFWKALEITWFKKQEAQATAYPGRLASFHNAVGCSDVVRCDDFPCLFNILLDRLLQRDLRRSQADFCSFMLSAVVIRTDLRYIKTANNSSPTTADSQPLISY